MALGMKDPSYWGTNEAFKPTTRKTLSPTRTWDITSGLTDRTLTIQQEGTALYTIQSHFTIKKDPYVTLHRKDDDKTAIAGAILDGSGSYHIYLGNPSTDHATWSQECEVTTGGNPRIRQHKFSPPAEQKDFAWRDTDQYEITIENTAIESTGRDWKLISLTPEGEEDELLAVYIHNPKASLKHKAQIFWFAGALEQVELWALAAVAGLMERKRRSKDKFNFTAMVGSGTVM